MVVFDDRSERNTDKLGVVVLDAHPDLSGHNLLSLSTITEVEAVYISVEELLSHHFLNSRVDISLGLIFCLIVQELSSF